MHKLKNNIFNIIIVLGSILISVIFIELILRLFLPISYSTQVEYVPDGHLGTRLQPNKVYTLRSGGTCTINNLGFRRTTNLTYGKPSDVIRIVVLGGSSTFSYHTDDARTWVALLEQQLKNRYGNHIEVINAGVPGYSIFESKINYLYQIRPLRPDMVIVYHTWNDMKFFHRIESGRYPQKGVFSGERFYKKFLRNFQIAWRIRNFLHEVVYPYQRENSFGSESSRGAITPNGSAHHWERQNFDDLAMLLKKDNILPIFTSQGSLLSSENLHNPAIRAIIYTEYVNLSYEDILTQWLAILNIIKTSAEENNISFIDIYNQVPHTKDFFADHVHLTEGGNSKVAEVLFNEIVRIPDIENLLLGQK